MMSKNKNGLEEGGGGYAEKWSQKGVTFKKGAGGGGLKKKGLLN